MALFLVFLVVGHSLGLGMWEYPFRFLVLAAVLWLCSRHVVSLAVKSWLGSIGVGVAVFVIWVAPDLLWPGYRSHWIFENHLTGEVASSFPEQYRDSVLALVFRCARAAILVPIIEEIFWRSWLMRWLIKPNFESVPLGTYQSQAFWITAVLFAVEHGSFWEVGLIAGVIYNLWMIRTRSLGDCILAHAVTNGILSAYVIAGGHWQYW